MIYMSSLLMPLSSLSLQLNGVLGTCTHNAHPLMKTVKEECNDSEQDHAASTSTTFASDPSFSQTAESTAAQTLPGMVDIKCGIQEQQPQKQPAWLRNVLATSPLSFLAFLRHSMCSGSRTGQLQQVHKLLWLCTSGESVGTL